jgi:hypothetical protein
VRGPVENWRLKKRLKKGSSNSGDKGLCVIVVLVKILTTAGADVLTKGAKDSRISDCEVGSFFSACTNSGEIILKQKTKDPKNKIKYFSNFLNKNNPLGANIKYKNLIIRSSHHKKKRQPSNIIRATSFFNTLTQNYLH